MEEYKLVRPNIADEIEMNQLMKKWRDFGGRINPGVLKNYDGDYSAWLQYISECNDGINIGENVPQTLFFLKDSNGTIVGATSLRHYINHTNVTVGGHVAYGICPEHRGKGLGNLVLQLALDKLFEMKIYKVLITCDTDNILSSKVIEHNGGVLENQTYDENGISVNRYWIDNNRI